MHRRPLRCAPCALSQRMWLGRAPCRPRASATSVRHRICGRGTQAWYGQRVASSLLFPDAATHEEFERVRRDDLALRPGVEAICARHGLRQPPIERFPEGSLPVYAVGASLVLKLYPPFDMQERDTESLVLQSLEGRLPILTPAIHAVGELDGWGYVLMTRLRGELLSTAWPRISPEDRIELADSLGRALAVLHAVEDSRLQPLRGGWNRFIEEQRRACEERQRALGLDPMWLAQIPEFLEFTFLGDSNKETLLHTEIMREHLFVEKLSRGWTFSGLFDFEPAMVGAAEYEFAAVGVFFSAGDSALLRRTLLAYGYAHDQLSARLSARLLAYALLHRYSNLAWYLRRVPPPAGVHTLEGLAEHWWGVQDR